MEKNIQRKLQQLEESYQGSRRYLEKELDLITDEKQQFMHYLEQITERIHCTVHNMESQNASNISSVHKLLEQAQEEGQQVVRKAIYLLENKLEENQRQYNQQITRYEEELYTLRKNRGQ